MSNYITKIVVEFDNGVSQTIEVSAPAPVNVPIEESALAGPVPAPEQAPAA